MSLPVAGAPGIGVDAMGGAVIDPTANVLSLVEAANQRQDDLREANNKYLNARDDAMEQMASLRAEHSREIRTLSAQHDEALRKAESARVDSIRQVDREDAAKTAAQVLQSVQTLATTASTTAETLRGQRATDSAEFSKRLSAVELALSEGKGKQTVADPQQERLAAAVEALIRAQATGTGKSEGIGMVGAILMGAVTIAAALYAVLK